ncbi:MAG: hypothetical protein OEV64_10655, partial [Desulfobulbaceae bacterium]|nr:hypothetical protein [Desulfobulbaceae bacterium]
IKGLNYNSGRIFKRFCLLPGTSFALFQRCWQTLMALHPTFEQVQCFEEWTRNFDVSANLALNGLSNICRLDFHGGKSFRLFCALPGVSPEFSLSIIPILLGIDESGHRALNPLLQISDISVTGSLRVLKNLPLFKGYQTLALEKFAAIKDMNENTILDTLSIIGGLTQNNAWFSASLFDSPGMDRKRAKFYLTSYFAVSLSEKEKFYSRLAAKDKDILLQSFYRGAEEVIWQINNLHSVTDRFGYEISRGELLHSSIDGLSQRFYLLSPQTTAQFAKSFNAAAAVGNKDALISLLKQATAIERKNTAETLSSAAIYCLMTKGSELYDSSFRDILTPIIQQRIRASFSDNLLNFLAHTDPNNHYISDFIISLAQKGKLTALLPQNSGVQQEILALTIDSAFKSEDSFILFSATFMQLLEILHPDAKTFLIKTIITKAQAQKKINLKLIIALLQYYQYEYGELLGSRDKNMIASFLAGHEIINLDGYRRTPFREWKADNKLASLSVFHPDDDGRISFYSNAATLITGGYRPRLSTSFTLSTHSAPEISEINRLIRNSASGSSVHLSALFDGMHRLNFAVDFITSLNNVSISHSVYIYQSPEQQQLLLTRFLKSDTEMFAQRGHSYWRADQLIDPLQNLLDSKEEIRPLLSKRQRFLSLGSCGGVKSYTKLNRLFLGKVDILATIGTGLASINDPYNKNLFEIIAANPVSLSWKKVADLSSHIFSNGRGSDYLSPGTLVAILHRLLEEQQGPLPGH